MQTIALTAPTGMIGSMVYNMLKDKYRLILIYRNEQKLKTLQEFYGGIEHHTTVCFDFMGLYHDYLNGFSKETLGPNAHRFFEQVGAVDGFVNCAGVTKAYSGRDPHATFFLNGVLPHFLSQWYGERLIHITTDCVYNGIEGSPYHERSLKNPSDLYGLAKSIGEPSERSLVLRTSTIGDELAEFVGLLAWFKTQTGKKISGFTNHYWNGITSREYGRICDTILSKRSAYPSAGLFHIFSNDISKYEMLCKFREKYKIDVEIIPTKTDPSIDRRLRTKHDVCEKLHIPSFDEMLYEL